ncbi:hypothetical protein [Sedimentibacter sp. MB31-C6]|uniref:hypothetical protein n=1 Tax=Sedimentibacter sp. MB31-C6 TaxID=3109366 RepID=UPI002DDD45C9|nr:hypothetical protein [Sedimentibacter sp. MB36-C1]WSI04564.1 hypothetical protein U8307_01915 [Sedimentibacter sp. MB36-C1]
MKHYDYIEWLFYKNRMLSKEKSVEMEQHLYNCNTCMEIFLSLVDEKEEEKAGEIISDDFTSNIISNIPKVKQVKQKGRLKIKQAKKAFNYQFGYYAAVASVTVILTLGGFYVDLVDAVPRISASMQITENRQNMISGFSNSIDSIVDITSSFLLSIDNSNINNRRTNNER